MVGAFSVKISVQASDTALRCLYSDGTVGNGLTGNDGTDGKTREWHSSARQKSVSDIFIRISRLVFVPLKIKATALA